MDNEKKTEMLVSVVVITYNSAEFVQETLDSIAAQTYQNLELIVTDDCSQDNTVEICQKWIEKHKGRFVWTELLTVEKNTGIAGNCNRGYAVAHSEWIKGIAGDDILRKNCIEICVNFVIEHPEKIYLAYLQEFGSSNKINRPSQKFEFSSASQQLNMILMSGLYVAAPSCFCKKILWKKLGGFDENYPLFEDLPFYVKALIAGERIGIIPEILVDYRVNCDSVSQSGVFSKDRRSWCRNVLIPLQKEYGHFFACWHTALTLWRTDFSRAVWINHYPLYGLWLILDPIAFKERFLFNYIKWHIPIRRFFR